MEKIRNKKNLGTIIDPNLNECLYFRNSLEPVLPVRTFIKYLQKNCYNCNGINTRCEYYLPMSAVYSLPLNGVTNGKLIKIMEREDVNN